MSFSMKIENSSIFKAIIDTLSGLIDETEFVINEQGFSISAMDPSRICLLKLELDKTCFDEFECEKGKTFKLGINLDDMDKIMKRMNQKDSLEFSFKENDQIIKIKMVREGSSRTRTFSLSLIDLDLQEVPLENLFSIEYETKWIMNTNFLDEAIKDAEIYSEIIGMKSVKDDGLKFHSEGQIGEMTYEIGKDELEQATINDTSGSYSITFLKNILKISNITEELEISLKLDHPLKMNFNLLEGGKLTYFLAPRVEEMVDWDDEEFNKIE